MNDQTKTANQSQKASLAAFVDHPEKPGEPFNFCPLADVALPLRNRHRDPRPAVLLTVVGLFIALGIGLLVYIIQAHALDKNKPHIPAKNIPMVVVGEPK